MTSGTVGLKTVVTDEGAPSRVHARRTTPLVGALMGVSRLFTRRHTRSVARRGTPVGRRGWPLSTGRPQIDYPRPKTHLIWRAEE